MKTILVFHLFLATLLYSCASNNNVAQILDDYLYAYNERQNFEKFMSFYAEEIVLEDIINGDRISGKDELKIFFDWDNPNFEKSSTNNLVVLEKIIQENKVVIMGYFNKFSWGETEFEAMHFTTILVFNERGKIIRHTDWINYPKSLSNYDQRKNSNNWITYIKPAVAN